MTEEQTQPGKRRFRRAAATSVKYLISPSFTKIKSPSPFKVQFDLTQDAIIKPLHKMRDTRQVSKQIDETLDGVDLDPEIRDRLVFEAFVRFNKRSDVDLATRHNGFIKRAYLLFFIATAALIGLSWLFIQLSDVEMFISQFFWNTPLLIAISLLPPVIVMYLSGIRYLYNAYPFRERRSGSLDAFLLWITSPGLWFPNKRFHAIPMRDDLPKELLDFDFSEANAEMAANREEKV